MMPHRRLWLRMFAAAATLLAAAAPLAAQTPIDVADSEVAPNVFALATADHSVEVAWRRTDGKLVLSRFPGPNWQTAEHFVLPTNLQLLGGFARDDAGNRYIAAMKDEVATPQEWAAGHRRDIVHLLRVPAAGGRMEVLADVGLPAFSGKWPVINPIRMADGGTTNSELVYNSRSGLLALAFGHNNGAANNIHQTGTLLALDTAGNPRYNGGGEQHCVQECLAVDGDAIVMAQVFDQGIGLSTLKNVGGKQVWSDFVLVYEIPRANQHEETLVVAGIVPTPDAYLVVFCSGKGWLWRQRGYDHGLDGACAIKILRVARNFDALPKFSWPDNKHAQGNFPLTTLAAPDAGKSYVRPLAAALAGGESVVVFEQWGQTPGMFPRPVHEGARAVRFDNAGAARGTSGLFPGARIPRSTRAFTFPAGAPRLGWVQGDAAGNRLMLHTLDAQLTHNAFELGRASVVPARTFTANVRNSAADVISVRTGGTRLGAVPPGEVKAFANLPDGAELLVSDGQRTERFVVSGADLAVTFAAGAPPVNRDFTVTVRNQSPDNVAVRLNGQRLAAVPFQSTKILPGRYPAGTIVTLTDGAQTHDATVQGDLVLEWPTGAAPPAIAIERLLGRYVRDNPENNYHDGEIVAVAAQPGRPAGYKWRNKDGVEWKLNLDLARGEFTTEADNPYFESNPDNGRKFRLLLEVVRNPDGTNRREVLGFSFLDEVYRKQN